ncbi:MAG: DUF169 domain-containing protein [Desulfarculaceae bacterium]|nr:DUF169 domain-containing protein [Desulfarculaceae bacterium]
MPEQTYPKLDGFLETLGLGEEPLGLFYTDQEPAEGFTPKPLDQPTRQKEIDQRINWQEVFGGFSCVLGHIWRARKKHRPAYFSAEQFGCPGGSFWLGFHKPQTETIIAYVSSGIPGAMEGEFYCESPDELRRAFEQIDPPPAPAKYCVVKPLSLFTAGETPELVIFFGRPESLSGLHQLAYFVTNDPEVVASPWAAACGGLAAWPLRYLAKGQSRAVLGGWDPSARKFFNTDELSFTVPLAMFQEMLARYEESFLHTKTWKTVQKKIARSNKAWS